MEAQTITRDADVFGSLSLEQFCQQYSISRAKAYLEVDAGRLVFRKLGKKTLVRRADAEAWLNSLPATKRDPRLDFHGRRAGGVA